MCDVLFATIGSALGAGGAGAAAGAAGSGLALQQFGTLLSIGGALYQGVAANRAANAQVDEIERQKAEERNLNAVKDQRTRQKFASSIRQQSAELAARGVALDSPTAVLLGQEAAREMSFESQSVRATGQATQRELSASQRIARSRGVSSLIRGGVKAAGTFIDAAPDVWPELLS